MTFADLAPVRQSSWMRIYSFTISSRTRCTALLAVSYSSASRIRKSGALPPRTS